MIRSLFAVFAALAALAAAPAQAMPQARSPEPVRVMVVGSFHFDNPGQDLHNARIAPVTTPERQAELAAVAETLARFSPTAVAVERVAPDPDSLIDPNYERFRPEHLLTNADERVQIGYRLAARAGISRVYAIDEQSRTRDYFPYGPVVAWAEAHGRSGRLQAAHATIAEGTAALERALASRSLGWVLADYNRPDHPLNGAAAQRFYNSLILFGDGHDQPGAALNAGWYERNARIFARLAAVSRPGDRIVVVIGSGHLYWLRHFISETPGFELVEASPWLQGL